MGGLGRRVAAGVVLVVSTVAGAATAAPVAGDGPHSPLGRRARPTVGRLPGVQVVEADFGDVDLARRGRFRAPMRGVARRPRPRAQGAARRRQSPTDARVHRRRARLPLPEGDQGAPPRPRHDLPRCGPRPPGIRRAEPRPLAAVDRPGDRDAVRPDRRMAEDRRRTAGPGRRRRSRSRRLRGEPHGARRREPQRARRALALLLRRRARRAGVAADQSGGERVRLRARVDGGGPGPARRAVPRRPRRRRR